jgi:hypothetical protein
MAEWTTAYINDLPDSAFACTDAKGRHYPHHDASGKVDMAHLRNAMSRMGDTSNTQCGKAHLEAHAKAMGMGERKAELPMKATLLDDDAFRLLALPYGGPIPYPGAPRGADLDRQWFSERTNFGRPAKAVPVTWHHGKDPWARRHGLDPVEVIGTASDLEFDDDGGWVRVWLDAGKRRTRLIKAIAEAAETDPEVGIFGSAEAVVGSGRIRTALGVEPWRPMKAGEIVQWYYDGQTLSTSPQNTKSILQPVKATLDDLRDGEIFATPDYFDDLARFLDNLGSDLAPTPDGRGEAKAGRVLASRNEARLREARDLLDESYFDAKRRRQAIAAIDKVLSELSDREALMRSVEL